MNITLNLSASQLRNLRNGKGIRISPAMFGSGVDMIVDPMNYHNLMKKLERGKGAVMSMGNDELDENEIQGTGLFAGAGNKSGKISRRKKAGKWKDFAVETGRDGIDLARYGYEQYKEATNPLASEGKKVIKGLSKMFGGEMEGDGLFDDIKKGYNRKVKNSKLGSALRESAGNVIGDVYDRGGRELGKNKYGKTLSQYMKDTKGSNVKRLTGYTGLGMKLSGEGRVMRPAVVRHDLSKLKHGKGLRMSANGLTMGGNCEMCGGSMNDKFLFADASL